jgi:predicted Zn-dependent protease
VGGHIVLGRILLGRGDAVGARDELEAGTRADSTDAVNWVRYGQALTATGEPDLALVAMRHGVDAMSKSPLAYPPPTRAWVSNEFADAVVAVHNRSYALAWYRDALQAVPGHVYATRRLHDIDSLTKVLTDSAARLRLHLMLAPDDTNAYNAASTVLHEELLDPKAALEVTGRWLTRHPGDLAARLNRAENYFTAERYAEADTAIRRELAKPLLSASQRIAMEAVGLATDVALGRTTRIQARFASIYTLVLQQPDSFTVAWVFFGTRRAVRNDDRVIRARSQLLPLFSALGAPNKAAILSRLDAARPGLLSIR